ncbi:hypothetical protein SAMN02910298_01354 [Pseudobutyrivibrio sp. YE44]|uniref:fibronectin type III domain-containing protein n=1 Tax=Pseudobutyrivibrio sp. YE44 TaxID=1520802 RepID=UPI00088DF37F|nr:fibronectin type III domain-containing protein [Pseudobutyrivibrio sp. YE44]SDB28114.1 hypothetical protein SAMN02910298_01354 [Pseudobutyrivibrio sp. YE44]
MKENIKAIKRLVAFFLCVFMVGSMVGNDIFAVATEENNCSEYVDEQTYAANVLQPVGEGDGYCDNCGHVEQSHVEQPSPEPAAEPAPEQPVVDENGNPIQEENVDTQNDGVSESNAQNPTPENAENPENINNPENPDDETDAENKEEEPKLDENGNPIVEEDKDKTDEDCEHDWSYTSNGDGTHVKKCSKCGQESTEGCTLNEEGKCELCGYQKSEETEEAECEHEWEYVSNEDGTHTKRCTKCGEETIENCQLNEEGKCELCGYEEPEECEHEWEYVDNKDGTHTKKCSKCGEEIIEAHEFGEDGLCECCGAADMTLEEQSYSQTFGDTTVTVSGMMPRHSKVTIYRAGTKIIERIVNERLDEGVFTAYEAFNINIYDAGGKKYQPNENDDTLKVSFSGLEEIETADEEEVTVYRIEDDYEITEIETEVKGDEVEFEAEHFSTYVTGSTSSLTYEEFDTYQSFAAIATASNAKAYTKINKAKFDIYAEKNEEYSFEAKVYRNPTSAAVPTSGTEIATGTESFKATKTGYYTIDIDLAEKTTGNGYISAGSTYAIVITHNDNIVNLAYGTNKGESVVWVKGTGSTWTNSGIEGAFYLDDDTMTLTDTPPGDYSVTNITTDDTRLVIGSDGKYYVAKMASSDAAIDLSAVLSDTSVERTVTWTSGASAVASVTANGAMKAKLRALSSGEATISASINGGTPATITIVVLNIQIGGVDAIGDVISYDTDYTGSEIKPTVNLYKDSTGTPVSTGVGLTWKDNTKAGKATVTVTYKAGTTTLTYTRYFTINPLNIATTSTTDSQNAFKAAEFTISGGSISAVTNVNSNNALAVTPVYGTDFTAVIDSLNGITNTVTVTGIGNFTGEVTVDYTPTDISSVITAELSGASRLKSCYYTGADYTLTAVTDAGWSEVTFYNSNSVAVTNVIKNSNSTYAIYDYVDGYSAADYAANGATASPKNAGKKAIVFTMNAGSGYTGSVMTSFNIQKADMANTTVVWTNGTGEFPHTGKVVEPTKGTDYKVYLNYQSATDTGVEVDVTDYVETYPVDHINTTDTPYVKLTGAGVNFDATTFQKKSYTIVANYELDLVVRIGDNGTTYDGTYQNGYATGYSRYFDGTKTKPSPSGIPSLTVRLDGALTNGTDYTYEVYDSYTDADNHTEFSENVGTKYIVITPIGNYVGKPVVTATYEVVKRPLSDAVITKTFGDDAKIKTFTGAKLLWSTAVSGDTLKTVETITDGVPQTWSTSSYTEASEPDLTIKYGSTYLEEGVDYTINYGSNYINEGKVSPVITGAGNYTGTLSGSEYQYKINPHTLTDSDVAIYGTPDLTYSGFAKYPDVSVSFDSYSEIYNYSDSSSGTTNYTVSYVDNISPGTATITITGKNNLTGSAIINFTIGTNTKAYKEIWIAGKYQAEYWKEDPIVVDGNTVGYTRYYRCPNLVTYYTGSKYNGSVKVLGSNGETLTKNTDYSASYNSYSTDVNTSTDYSSTSPCLKITGLNDYANNNAIVYFNIQPVDISSDDITWSATEDDNFQKAWTGSPVELSNIVITVNGNELSGPDVDPDTGAEIANTGDYTITYPTDITSAGEKTITVTGRGNYTGTRTITYTVGSDISNAYITINAAYQTTGSDVFVNTALLKTLMENNGTEATSLANTVRWRGSSSDYAPKIILYTDSTAATTLTAGTDYTITDVPEFGTGNYASRRAGEETSANFNTVHVTIAAKDGANKYYGTVEFYYDIYPALMDSRVSSDGKEAHRYEGELDTAITITPKLSFNDGTAIKAYELNSGTKKDYEPATYKIGPNVTSSSVTTTITGVGNFTGEKILNNKVVKGYVKIKRSKNSDGSDTPVLVADTTNESSVTTFTYNLSDDTKDYYTAYKYNGSTQYPLISVYATDGVTKLTAGTDYSISIVDENGTTLTEKAGKKVITIAISEAHTNIEKQTITMTYMVNTNSIETYSATLSDIPYESVKRTAEIIKGKVEDKNDSTTLTLKVGDTELEYGTDYEIVTADTDGSILTAIKAQTSTSSETAIQGANNKPGVGGTNYIYLHGLNAYSGYLKVPFNHVLNLSSVYAKVYIEKASYELGADGIPTQDITPVILYRQVGESGGTYGGNLNDITPVLGNVTVTRARDKLPGPDLNITVTGKADSACKGSATQCKYETTTAGGTATSATVYFLADLGTYTGITMNSGTVYEYTGQAVTVSFAGLEGATKAETAAQQGDYAVIYTTDYTATATSTDAVDVGTWYAVIVPTDESKYFITGKTSGNKFSFQIKYNLGSSNTKIKYDADGVEIDRIPYTGSDIAVPATIYAAYGLKKADGSNAQIIIYDHKLATNSLVSITPETVKKMGDYPILAEPKDTTKVYGTLNDTFTVSGVDIANATVTLEYDTHIFTGDPLEPTVTVKIDNDVTLKKNTDYTVSYSGNVNVGTASVTIKGINGYSGGTQKTFTITPETITADMITVADAYYAGAGVEVKPAITVKNGTHPLTEGVDYAIVKYGNNTSVGTGFVQVTAGTGSNYVVPSGDVIKNFPIGKLDLRSTDITVNPSETEWTGTIIDPYDKITVKIGDKELISYKDSTTAFDYKITVLKNGVESQLKDQGAYKIRIDGTDSANCAEYIEKDFTVTERSLPNNYHHYYSGAGNAFVGSSWTYDSTNKRYVSQTDGAVPGDTLTIYVYDVENVGATDNPTNAPTISIVDDGAVKSIDTTTGVVTYGHELSKDTDYTVAVVNNTKAGSAAWSKTLKDDDTHALPTADSPAVTITGKGNYKGSITLPYNIGKNINTLTGLTISYKVGTTTYDHYDSAYDHPTTNQARWQYTYNGVQQVPDVTVKNNGTNLRKDRDYTISYTDAADDEDESITAGYKNVVVTGIGNYCGTMSQMYVITRKQITDTAEMFTNENPMATDNGVLKFEVTGNAVSKFTAGESGTAKKYLVDTGIMSQTEADKFVGYYYAVYNGESIKPKVTVKDTTLGRNGTTSMIIDEESDLDITYDNENTVTTYSKDSSDVVTLMTYSTMIVKFKGTSDNDIGNYYTTSSDSIAYKFAYIIVQHNIETDFIVSFKNGVDGNKYEYDDGKEIRPEVEVTNGTRTLVENQDYQVDYENNIKPGVATVIVEGIGNYRGSKTLEYYIWGNLSDTDVYYKEGNEYVQGIPEQDYTGTNITYGSPRIYLILRKQNALDEDYILKTDTDYKPTGYSSTDGYITDGTVVYTGQGSGYWMGDKSINYGIEFNPDKIEATNYKESYAYTGYPIVPDFGLNYPTATITDIKYYRNGDMTSETDDFTSLTGASGKITAVIHYKVGKETGDTEADYRILPRSLSDTYMGDADDDGEGISVILQKETTRYTGQAVTPALKVLLISKNLKTGKTQEITLTRDDNGDGDYSVEYGNYVYGNAEVVLTGTSDEITGTTTETYTIKLQSVANLRVTENTGTSLTVKWVRDLYSDGTRLILRKLDSDGNVVSYRTVSGLTGNTYTFDQLTSSTTYEIAAIAYAGANEGIKADEKTIKATTDISTTDIDVISKKAGKATITMAASDTVDMYYIYFSETEDDEGKVLAIIPASTGKFTKSGLTSGKTYYVHLEGYVVEGDNEPRKVNASSVKPVTIK